MLVKKNLIKKYSFWFCQLGVTLVLAAGCADAKQVNEYIRQLENTDPHVRSEAALNLGRVGAPLGVNAVPKLISLLRDSNTGVQSAATYALRKIDTPDAREALERVSRFKK